MMKSIIRAPPIAKEEAIPLFGNGFLSQDISITDITRLLQICAKEQNRSYAIHLHDFIKNLGMDTHPSLGNYLVSMLVSVGSIQDAQQVFDRLLHRNEWAWNSLISGYVKNGKPENALRLYQNMQSDESVHPTAHTFVSLLKACAELKDLKRGTAIHAKLSEIGLIEKNLFIGSCLIDMYAKCGSLKEAQEIFDLISVRDVVSWTSLISGYAEHGLGENALTCFEQMQLEGVCPNAATFVCILKVCCNLQAADMIIEIHAKIEKKGLLEISLVLGSTLVDVYVKLGCLAAAQNVFDRVPTPDVVSWTSLISGYAENGQSCETLRWLKKMQENGIAPNAATLVCCLKACCSTEALDKGQEMHSQAEKQGLLEGNNILGSALVDMYAKCGLIGDAEEVFNKLAYRDVVSWTAMITGYGEYGNGNEALNCFQQMQLEGVKPNAATFLCILKACAKQQALEKCEELYNMIQRQGLLEEPFLGSALVDMFAKCGCVATAENIFKNLPHRDVVSWTTLISGYVEHGFVDKALCYFEQMQREGVEPNAATLVCSLKAYAEIGATEKVQEIHAEANQRGLFMKELEVGNALVYAYCKCGLLSSAQKLIKELPILDVVSWTSLISGYVDHGCFNEALECFKQMKQESVYPNAVTYSCVLKACSATGAMDKGQEIHAEIERRAIFDNDVELGNDLVKIYAEFGSFAKAHQIFEIIGCRNTSSWNALISGSLEHGQYEEVMKYFSEMQLEGIAPDVLTFIYALEACGTLGTTVKAHEMHSEIIRSGLIERELMLGSCLVNAYSKLGCVSMAAEVFQELPCVDVVSWTALITCYDEHGHCQEALNSFYQMQLEGVLPNSYTITSILNTCGNMGNVKEGQKVHTLIGECGFSRDDIVVSAVVDMYVKCGLLTVAENVFENTPIHGVVSWSTLITGYAENGCGKEAMDCLTKMKFEDVPPNEVTYLSSLKACMTLGAMEKGGEIHSEIERRGYLESYHVGNALVNMYAKCGSLAAAQYVFDKLPVQDLVACNTLITGYAKSGDIQSVFHVFDRMKEKYVRPDAITFLNILGACSRIGLPYKSQMYFDAMKNEYGILPDLEHHTCVVDFFGRSGQLDKAAEMINQIPCYPDLAVWNAMLGACKHFGQKEYAKEAFGSVVGWEKRNATMSL